MNWFAKLFFPLRRLSAKELKDQLAMWRKRLNACNPLEVAANTGNAARIRAKIKAVKKEYKRRGLPA